MEGKRRKGLGKVKRGKRREIRAFTLGVKYESKSKEGDRKKRGKKEERTEKKRNRDNKARSRTDQKNEWRKRVSGTESVCYWNQQSERTAGTRGRKGK